MGVFPAKGSTFAYSMPHIFGKLWHLALIWAIRKAFQCILQGVRILLAKYTRISPTSDNDSYVLPIYYFCHSARTYAYIIIQFLIKYGNCGLCPTNPNGLIWQIENVYCTDNPPVAKLFSPCILSDIRYLAGIIRFSTDCLYMNRSMFHV